jgi:hypothetical protein
VQGRGGLRSHLLPEGRQLLLVVLVRLVQEAHLRLLLLDLLLLLLVLLLEPIDRRSTAVERLAGGWLAGGTPAGFERQLGHSAEW